MGLLNFISKQIFSNTYEDEKGYKRFKDSDKPVHRYVAEKKYGRNYLKGKVVHHKDRDKQNNSWNNLYACTPEEHDRIHKRDAAKHGKKASYQGFKKKKKSFWDFLK